MRILVIEDDQNKRDQLVSFLMEELPYAVVQQARSLQSGLKAIMHQPPSLILLDVSMPTFDISASETGGRPQVYAGGEVLRQMRRLGLDIPVIVVTQFDQFGDGPDALTLDQVDARLRSTHPISYRGSVYYNVVYNEWKAALREKLCDLNASNRSLEA